MVRRGVSRRIAGRIRVRERVERQAGWAVAASVSAASRERCAAGREGLRLRPSFCGSVAVLPPRIIWLCRSGSGVGFGVGGVSCVRSLCHHLLRYISSSTRVECGGDLPAGRAGVASPLLELFQVRVRPGSSARLVSAQALPAMASSAADTSCWRGNAGSASPFFNSVRAA